MHGAEGQCVALRSVAPQVDPHHALRGAEAGGVQRGAGAGQLAEPRHADGEGPAHHGTQHLQLGPEAGHAAGRIAVQFPGHLPGPLRRRRQQRRQGRALLRRRARDLPAEAAIGDVAHQLRPATLDQAHPAHDVAAVDGLDAAEVRGPQRKQGVQVERRRVVLDGEHLGGEHPERRRQFQDPADPGPARIAHRDARRRSRARAGSRPSAWRSAAGSPVRACTPPAPRA